MKRKKWSEQEEQSLLSKYSELQTLGALSKLKTREKKFRPIADHVNASHHGTDPAAFPIRWSWRDVSIKVQNMRHQYLCVKQKIRDNSAGFNWDDGDNHWQNFLAYKSVFGDIDLDSQPNNNNSEEEEFDETRYLEERARRMRAEEQREEEDMEWRERMMVSQIEHEKEIMRMHHSQMQLMGAMARLVCQFFGAEGMGGALSNQVMANLEHHHHNHHSEGGPELGDNGKPDDNSPSEFI